jgi:hypothetical protein
MQRKNKVSKGCLQQNVISNSALTVFNSVLRILNSCPGVPGKGGSLPSAWIHDPKHISKELAYYIKLLLCLYPEQNDLKISFSYENSFSKSFSSYAQ